MNPKLGLGIDAGGTYTDTVIVNLDTGKVLCGNKALTTRRDLTEGIRNSILGLDHGLFKDISLVSLSSTLATNSVVENKGCRVGLICIGKSYLHTSEPDFYAEIDGKFDMDGTECDPLDVHGALDAMESMKGEIDALAVSGYISVRNPSHEDRVAKMASRVLDVPIVCGHDLTSKLGFEQRTTTAVMNARLIPVVRELLSSVRKVLADIGIDAPLMMVKGDGALMKDDVAMRKPVETILSGPASSLTGAKALTGIDDAMVVDMGGTTSDIGILKNGFPRIEPEGANIGGKRTRVMAADIATFGIGGDSRIIVNGKDILLSPVREIPVCIAAVKWPSVKEVLRSLSGITDDRSAEDGPLEDILQDIEFFTLAHYSGDRSLSNEDTRFLQMLADGPMRLSDAASAMGIPPHAISAALLESRGYITRIGVTPTDLLHAEGSYSRYDTEASELAAAYLARKCGMDTEGFISHTKDLIVRKIAACAVEKVLRDETHKEELDGPYRLLMQKAVYGYDEDYDMLFKLKYPVIGIGAPVAAWLPKVAEILHTDLVLPETYDIGNAIGAITGSVSETIMITIRAVGEEYIEEPECNVFTGYGVKPFERPQEALEFAIREGTRLATEATVRSGCRNPVIETELDEKTVDLGHGKKAFRGATLTVRATGKPDLG